MSEVPAPQRDPGDISEEEKQMFEGIVFQDLVERVTTRRQACFSKELQRHGVDSTSTDETTQQIILMLRTTYLAEESEALMNYLDFKISEAEHSEFANLQELDLLGEQILEIQFDYNGQGGFSVEQEILNIGEKRASLRWSGYHLVDGKISVVTLNLPRSEIELSYVEHAQHLQQELTKIDTERELGINDVALSSTQARRLNTMMRELSQLLDGFYDSVESRAADLGNWDRFN
jgi:hypothetical protein